MPDAESVYFSCASVVAATTPVSTHPRINWLHCHSQRGDSSEAVLKKVEPFILRYYYRHKTNLRDPREEATEPDPCRRDLLIIYTLQHPVH